MAAHLGLAETREIDRPRPFEPAEPPDALRQLGEIDAGLLGRADLEDQGLLEHQSAVAGDGLGLALLVGGSGWPPARRIDGHWTTSLRAASSAAMSSSVAVSVTAKTSPVRRAPTPG